jgi:hypothetical protein
MYGWNVNVGPTAVAPKPAPRSTRHAVLGLFAGTLVRSEAGWCRVETLSPGDLVWTFDNGLQPLKHVRQQVPEAPKDSSNMALVVFQVPAGGLGNDEDLIFLPGAGLLLECENASDAMGDPFAVVPIDALSGVCGVEKTALADPMPIFVLTFEEEQAVYIDSGLLVHARISTAEAELVEPRYDVKTVEEASDMLTDLDFAELALREADEDIFGEMASPRYA